MWGPVRLPTRRGLTSVWFLVLCEQTCQLQVTEVNVLLGFWQEAVLPAVSSEGLVWAERPGGSSHLVEAHFRCHPWLGWVQVSKWYDQELRTW